MNDPRTIALITGVLALLTAATGVGQFLKRHPDRGLDPAAVRTFNSRLRGWWILCTVLAAAFWLGTTATVVLFGLVSFWALREFITLTPTRKGDHRALFWVFVAFTPLHYVFVGLNRYDIFSVFLPVYATLFVLTRVAVAGDYKRFLERTAKIQAGLVVCVYCLSFAPALLQVPIPAAATGRSGNFRLLFFLILLVQFADCMQYVDERDQTRPRREGLWHAGSRPWRRARPHRLDVLRGSSLLPHHATGDGRQALKHRTKP
jgi:phosphatidate cytidylyltransferase